jgi:hypothetical protein
MGHVSRGIAWGGFVLFGTLALLARWFDATTWPFVVACLACTALLVRSRVRAWRLRAKLPEGLRGLWYRTAKGRVEFHWRWASPTEGRLRILRSDGPTIRAASDGDGGRPGVWRVFDGYRPYYAVDERLRPGATCRYAFFVGDADGGWIGPVRQTITAIAADDVEHLEASHRPPPLERRSSSTLSGAWEADSFGGGMIDGVTSLLIAPVVDATIDGVFDLLEALRPETLSEEGWISVI